MLIASMPVDEAERLRALRRLEVLDSTPEAEFDALAATAALICGVPISLVSLIDQDRQWFKANVGLPGVAETPRDQALCAHTILEDGVFEVPDALADPRFADNPFVIAAPDVRFYAGVPLRTRDGAKVGTLCVIDRVPRQLDDTQREALRLLSIAAVGALESRRKALAFVASEARFRTLSEASPTGVFATDVHGACSYTNARWQSIYGLSADEALGDGWSRALHPDDKAAVFVEWQRSAALNADFDMEFRVLRGDGTVRQVRSVARPVRDGNGDVIGYVGSVEDITDRLQAHRALDEQRERLAAILEGAGAGTWEWNVRTGEVRLNERWAEILGTTLDALGPISIRTWVGRVHPADRTRARALMKAHFAGETASYTCEMRMRHRDGHWVWVQYRGKVLTRTPDGRPEWMFGAHVDISARKAQEEQLRKSEALLERTGALAQVGGWEVDIAGGQVRWSDETCRIHGVSPGYQPRLDEAISFYAPEARPVIEAAVAKAMTDGHGWDLELPFVQQGGQRIWVRAVGNVEFEDGKPTRLFGAFQDITQRVQARQALEAAQQRVTAAAESGGIGIWERDLQTGEQHWDARAWQLFGFAADSREDPDRAWVRHVHPDDLAVVDQAIRETIERGRKLDVEFRVVWPDASVHYLHSAGRVVLDSHGRPAKMIGVGWDVTQVRELNTRLAEQHELLNVTLQSIGDAVITTDAGGCVTWLNPAAERLTGWARDEALGRPIGEVFRMVAEDTRQPTANPVSVCLVQGKAAGATHRAVLISRNGPEFGIEDSVAPIRNPAGEVLGAVLVFRDVTEQRRLSSEMSYRATHDALTGLVNRAEFETRLRRALERAREERIAHALLSIDLDHFKQVNDACGHAAGDRLLLQVAKLLRDTVRARDTLARLGGDEFAVILEHCSADQARRVAQQICDRMEQFQFVHDERRFRVGTSIGLVPLDDHWADIAAALQAADHCCYAAKQAGRNRVHSGFATDAATGAHHGETGWAARLEQALELDRFVLHAQMIEPARDSGAGRYVEILVRLREPDGSLIPPGAFLPAAQRFHMATRIDRWVLRHAIQRIQGLSDPARLDVWSVNLSGQSVGDRAFHQYAIDTLAEAGPDVCQHLCLELDETAALDHAADLSAFIDQARALGVRIALDDFGASVAFGYLKALKVDLLKIDGRFFRDLVDDPLDDAAVRCFVDVARVIGAKTVAKHVERPDTLRRVRDIGIDYAQGYLLHTPEPIERLPRERAVPAIA